MKKMIQGVLIVCMAIALFGVCAWVFLLTPQEDIVIRSVPQDVLAKNDPADDVQGQNNESTAIDHDVQGQSVHILFGGDMNFDRYIRTVASRKGYAYVIDDVGSKVDEYDCMIANLEGPVTDHESVSENSVIGSADNYRFTFDPGALDVLVEHQVCAVNIGNNHIENFGRDGIAQTKKYLSEKGIAYFGDTGDISEKRMYVVTIKGVRVGLVNYNAFVADAYAHTLSDVAEAREKSDVVIVYTHWGVEYQTVARARERDMARAFIDAGADLIIGSHPHVVQDVEEYKNKKIYYSLGNFVFDQYFQSETQKGLLVGVTYDKVHDTLSFRNYDIKMERTGKTVLMTQ